MKELITHLGTLPVQDVYFIAMAVIGTVITLIFGLFKMYLSICCNDGDLLESIVLVFMCWLIGGLFGILGGMILPIIIFVSPFYLIKFIVQKYIKK